MKMRLPDRIDLITEETTCTAHSDELSINDVCVRVCEKSGKLILTVSAGDTPLKFIRLRWNRTENELFKEAVHVFGDIWERAYGDMEWRSFVPDRCMPWVFAISNGTDSVRDYTGRFTECCGVMTGAAALCFWQADSRGCTLWADIRSGGRGVLLKGRKVHVCDVVFSEYRGESAFKSVCAFYKELCDRPLLPKGRIFGSNNWNYAYGVSSDKDILRDTDLISDLCGGVGERPFMVIDECWEKYKMSGPWDESREAFPDMKALACEMKNRNARPGIWVRYLCDRARAIKNITPEMRLKRDENYLDPSHPDVLRLVAGWTKNIVENWGFELIKHDFSNYDIFGTWGFQCKDAITPDGWCFYDRTRTSAEIVRDFYACIREAAGPDTVIIGCNIIGHLAAGLVDVNRTGMDSSGQIWDMNRRFGVNALAFRMPHDKAFYCADPDIVGYTGDFSWELNREWLRIVSISGLPFFTAVKPGFLTKEQLKEVRDAFAFSANNDMRPEPLDWMENICPERWLFNGEEITFSWYPETGTDFFTGECRENRI